MSDMRSLRSKDAAILGSMSIKASDFMLQESLRESIKISLRESAKEINELPIFRAIKLPSEKTHFTDDYLNGVYLG